MADRRDRKLYLGPRLRMLRRELGLNQTRMAEELGVSPSYLNHLERNQRPLTAQMLLRLADTYDLDVRGFVSGANEAAGGDLTEVLADELVRDLSIGRDEALEVAENYPGFAEAMRRLYQAVSDLRQLPGRMAADMTDGSAGSPVAWVREWVQARENHFPDLDAAAERLSAQLGTGPDRLRAGIETRLADQHRVGVRIVPPDVLVDATRHFDFHRRRLMLSERLSPATRLFERAAQLARLELGEPIAAALAEAGTPDTETAALARQMLVNYAAAAIVMPYARFHTAAEAARYELDVLTGRFGMSAEQVAHRLTTLGRSAMRGVPLFLLKLDGAGNIVKRYGGAGAPFARYGGGCPRWRVHDAIRRGGETVADLVETPEGQRFITWARAVRSYPSSKPALLILGCDAREAARIWYADRAGAYVATPIGPACHLCERPSCPERALPPVTRSLAISDLSRPIGRYAFRPI